MASKRRPLHTKLNFRPPTSDSNLEFRGTKPTSEPTSVKEAFTLMVLYVCKKFLFYNTNLKVCIYLGTLFLLSVISDAVSPPRIYFSRSDNILNKVFVKFAWGWNLTILVPFLLFTSYIYCCGRKERIIKHHLLRLCIATFFWWFWTRFFLIIEASFGKCGNVKFPTKGTCLHAGHVWNGFDISGHSFILIYGTLLLIEEARCMENWDSIKEHLRLEIHHRTTRNPEQNLNPLRNLTDTEINNLDFYYKKYTPYIRGLLIIIAVFELMWDIMLVFTILYYHIMVEKVLGGVIAILTWFVTYRLWYTHPKLFPCLPGDGVFRYIKKKGVVKEPVGRRRTGSIVNNGRGPLFMGRPIYPQSEQQQQQEDGGNGQ